jgi:uncharacterized protein (TIGR02466 family)
MKVDTQIITLFPKPLAIFKLNVDNKKLLSFIKKEIYVPTKSTIKNECNAYVSKEIQLLEKMPELKNNILQCTNFYLKEIFKYDIENFKIQVSWSTKVSPNGFSQSHSHSHSLISGVYYPIGDKGYKISFSSEKYDSFWDIPVKEYNLYNSNFWEIPIEDNQLILFHSHIKHKIEPNKSNKDRYSIAFNINPIGKVGKNDSEIYIN